MSNSEEMRSTPGPSEARALLHPCVPHGRPAAVAIMPKRKVRGARARGAGLPPPPPPLPPPSSFSVWAQAAILLLPRAGGGGLSLLQVRPPAVPPLHGRRPLRTVSPRPLPPTLASLSGCHFRRGAPSGGGGGQSAWPVGYRRRSRGSAPEGRSPSTTALCEGASGPTLLPSTRSSPRRRVIPRPLPCSSSIMQTVS